jgi:hypothetical protein
MAVKLAYKILRSVGEETPKGNVVFNQLEQFVNEHIRDGWRPVGGITVSSIVGPKTVGSIKDNWFGRAVQAMGRKIEE